MKIDLNTEEFKILLHMSAVAQRVICMDGLLSERDSKQIATDELLKKLEQLAPDFDAGDMIEEEDGSMYLSEEYMDEVFGDLDEYEEYGFYEKGAQFLGWRDIYEQYTEEELENKTDEQRYDIVRNARGKYLDEWEKFGHARLRIVPRPFEVK